MSWITDWSKIEDDTLYIVSPINARASDGTLYLAGPNSGFQRGWAVKRLMKGCYAALPFPTWDGIVPPSLPKQSEEKS